MRLNDEDIASILWRVRIAAAQHSTVMSMRISDVEQMLIELKERRATDAPVSTQQTAAPVSTQQQTQQATQRRWLAWAIEHDSHGPSINTLVFLPEGDKPESDAKWRRMPWLDEPALYELWRALVHEPEAK